MGIKTKINEYINEWEKRCYNGGIPNETPNEIESNLLAPSYKMICRAIIKNDFALKTLGFDIIKCKEYVNLKRIEIDQRGTNKQLKLFQ